MTQRVSASYLIATLQDARARTLELVNDLDQEQLMGSKLPGVNPPVGKLVTSLIFTNSSSSEAFMDMTVF